MSDRRTTVKAGALLLIAGGIIGAGVALLFAPQSGKATRKTFRGMQGRRKEEPKKSPTIFSESISRMVEHCG